MSLECNVELSAGMEEMLFSRQHWVLLQDLSLPNLFDFKTRSTLQALLVLFAAVVCFGEWFPSGSSGPLPPEVPNCPSLALVFGVRNSVRDPVMQNWWKLSQILFSNDVSI